MHECKRARSITSEGKQSTHPQKWWTVVAENATLFLESISIRGCSRIVKAQSWLIRILWICFLVLTTVFLVLSVNRVVSEYLLYTLNIELEEEMDAPTAFPSVTFCNHQPFSENAYELWRQGIVTSPTEFNRILRSRANHLVRQSHEANETFPIHGVAQFSIDFDSIKVYYQNLEWPYHKWLGHQRNQSIYMCLIRLSGEYLALGGPGCHDSMIQITERSHPHHFNCYTVNMATEWSKTVQELGMIIWLGPPENYDIQYRQAFLQDVFEQAHGLRVALHEPGHLASLDRLGIQIEPGRLNEINFEVIRKESSPTPRKPCIANPQQTYTDLEGTYLYDFELCLQTHLQRIMVKECQCLYAYLPRIHLPSAHLPYCGRLIENGTIKEETLFQRRRCALRVAQQFASIRKQLETDGKCLHRCGSVEYDNRVSITTWRTTRWQQHWSQETADSLEHVSNQMPDPSSEVVERLMAYLQTSNLSSELRAPNTAAETITGKYGFSDRHTYLLVKRKRNDTIVRKEALVLTMDALVSRIGGLCSLYIGMTFAIFMEIIEYIYLVFARTSASWRSRNTWEAKEGASTVSNATETLESKVAHDPGLETKEDKQRMICQTNDVPLLHRVSRKSERSSTTNAVSCDATSQLLRSGNNATCA